MSTMSIKDLSPKQRSNVESVLRDGFMDTPAQTAVTAIRTRCHVKLSPQGVGKLRTMLRDQATAHATVGGNGNAASQPAPQIVAGSTPGGSPVVLTRQNYMFEIARLDKTDLQALAVHLFGENDRLKEDLRVATQGLDRQKGLLLKVMQQQ